MRSRYTAQNDGPGCTPAVATFSAVRGVTVVLGIALLAITASAAESGAERISVDIRPGLCPNHLRIESPLTIPIAITGRTDFEVAGVDPSTIRLAREGFAQEVPPLGWIYADVGTPVVGGLCACHKLRGDGIDDLEFEFSIRDIARAFDLDSHEGSLVELTLKGNLATGEEIVGSDCALVINGLWEDENLGRELSLLAVPQGAAQPGEYKLAYRTTVSDRVTLAIYDMSGRVVSVLNDMDMAPGIYTATWNGLRQDKQEAPAGIYFARVSNSLASDIMKVSLAR